MHSDNNENLENPTMVPESEKIAKQLLESNFERKCSSFKVEKDLEKVENFLNEIFYPLINLPTPLPASFYTSAKEVVEKIYGGTTKELRFTHFLLIHELVKFGANRCGDVDFPGSFLSSILMPITTKKFGATWLCNLNETNWQNLFPENQVPEFPYIEKSSRQLFIAKYVANLFLEKGGVRSMLQKLERPESSLLDVYCILGDLTSVIGLWEIKKCPDGGCTFSEFKGRVVNLFETKMMNLTVEQCKTVDFKNILETIDRFKELLAYLFDRDIIEKHVNKVKLEVSFKWLKLPYIQKRVKH